MARLAQVSSGGWAADRPVGGLEGHWTPTPRQKQLRGNIVKIHHGRKYKKDLRHAQGTTTEGGKERT